MKDYQYFAEFSVKHYDLPQGTAQKFIVHTEGVNVEVMGTRFNLMSRGEKCKLALYKGKVELLLTKYSDDDVSLLVKIIVNIFNIKTTQNGKEIIFDNKN